jgi:hypothetical protein
MRLNYSDYHVAVMRHCRGLARKRRVTGAALPGQHDASDTGFDGTTSCLIRSQP